MPVMTREALEASPLADLHAIAREISIDGFRRLRKAELVDAILERQGGAEDGVAPEDVDAEAAGAVADDDKPKRRRSRGGRGRKRVVDEDGGDDVDDDSDDDEAPAPRRRGRTSAATTEDDGDAAEKPATRRRGRKPAAEQAADDDESQDRPTRRRGRKPAVELVDDGEDRDAGSGRRSVEDRGNDGDIAEGVVELLGNGSGFARVAWPEPSDDDIYVSAAQVRRCELVDGDKVAGPVRPARRSERFPSLVRIDTINGRPADEVAEGTPWDDLAAVHPTERLTFGSEDPTLQAIEWLAPIGRGSRVVLCGPALSGKTETLRRIAAALTGQDGLDVSLVLTGVRPEETSDWAGEPVATLPLGTTLEARGQALERAVDTARRLAARGGHAVLLVDSLDGVEPRTARKALAQARSISDGGSLTIVATATAPLGGETTIVALDPRLTAAGRFPALDLLATSVLRADLLVGPEGAEAILQARAAALGVS